MAALLLSLAVLPRTARAADNGYAANLASSICVFAFVVFSSADLTYAADGRWAAPGWAWPQGVFGLASTGLGIWVATEAKALGAFNIISGVWLLTHAVLSLWRYKPAPPLNTERAGLRISPFALSVRF